MGPVQRSGHVLALLLAMSAIASAQARPKMPESLRDALVSNPAKALTILKKNPKLVRSVSESQETPLHLAAQCGTAELVVWLLKQGAEPNARSYNEFTPLHLADTAPIATALLKGGANPKLRAVFGSTPLQYMAFQALFGVPGCRQVAEAIRQGGEPLDLYTAQCLGKLDVARMMIRARPSVAKKVEVDGRTPLHLAAYMGDLETAKLLLAIGFDVDHGNYVGMNFDGIHTPLWDAMINHQVKMVRFLCERGADPNKLGWQFTETQIKPVYGDWKPTKDELRMRAAAAEIAVILRTYAEKKRTPRPSLSWWDRIQA